MTEQYVYQGLLLTFSKSLIINSLYFFFNMFCKALSTCFEISILVLKSSVDQCLLK